MLGRKLELLPPGVHDVFFNELLHATWSRTPPDPRRSWLLEFGVGRFGGDRVTVVVPAIPILSLSLLVLFWFWRTLLDSVAWCHVAAGSSRVRLGSLHFVPTQSSHSHLLAS